MGYRCVQNSYSSQRLHNIIPWYRKILQSSPAIQSLNGWLEYMSTFQITFIPADLKLTLARETLPSPDINIVRASATPSNFLRFIEHHQSGCSTSEIRAPTVPRSCRSHEPNFSKPILSKHLRPKRKVCSKLRCASVQWFLRCHDDWMN